MTIQGDITDLQSQVIDVDTRIAAVPAPYQGATQLVAPAPLPTSPSNPKPARDAALGLVVGLALGLGIALLREHLDDRTAGRDELGRELGAPVIAVVPKVEGWRRKKTTRLVARDAPMSVAAESYRTARANLEFLAATHGTKTIVVTSAYLGEGKSATTANLAVTLAQTGKRVVAMSCDLRKPRLHRFFGITNEPGLADLLVGWASVEQVALRSEPSSLRVVASGSMPPNPAELLGSEQMAKFLHDLREITDYIVIDTPPVLAVSDALILARLADGVIVVADAASTTRGALVQTREQLEQIGSRIIGAIYNNFDPSKSKSYSSGYYHGYYARHEPSTNGRSEWSSRRLCVGGRGRPRRAGLRTGSATCGADWGTVDAGPFGQQSFPDGGRSPPLSCRVRRTGSLANCRRRRCYPSGPLAEGLLDCSMISSRSIVVASREQVSADLAGEAAVLNLRDGVYYGLDKVATNIPGNSIDGAHARRGHRRTLLREYDVDPDSMRT